jgi:peptidoglycan-N-acetylglucosamine deacetylase
METDDEEAERAASILLRSFLMAIALTACIKPEKGKSFTFQPTVEETKDPATVTEKPPPKKKKKKVYLTFDDGPNKGTMKVLHIIQQEQVPVSFFLIGEHAEASAMQQAAMDSLEQCELAELCNHSYTHAWHNQFSKFYEYADSVVKDFEKCRDSLQLQNNIVRTPGRNIWRTDSVIATDIKRSAVAADSVFQAGFNVMGWDLEWHYDGKDLSLKNNADSLLNQLDSAFAKGKTKTPDHLVLLAHDQVYEDAADSTELHYFIRKIKERDLELEVVSRYPNLRKQ